MNDYHLKVSQALSDHVKFIDAIIQLSGDVIKNTIVKKSLFFQK